MKVSAALFLQFNNAAFKVSMLTILPIIIKFTVLNVLQMDVK